MYVLAVQSQSGQYKGPRLCLDFQTNSIASVQREDTVKHKERNRIPVAERNKILSTISGFVVAENLHNIFSKSDFSISFHNNKQW